jgi:hypothetical protein
MDMQHRGMDMQHGQAPYMGSMNMQHEYAAWIQEHAAWKSSMDKQQKKQPFNLDIQYGHTAWTCSIETRTCSIDMEMHHEHGHPAWTWTYSMDMSMQHGH